LFVQVIVKVVLEEAVERTWTAVQTSRGPRQSVGGSRSWRPALAAGTEQGTFAALLPSTSAYEN
jgi:hypothetical protein